jgi:hypothetical protein
MQMASNIPVLVITGPVGVGKTATGMAVSEILDDRGWAYALIDMDWLRWSQPRPAGDPFHTALGLRNLAAVWANCRATGAERLVLVDVVETGRDVERYREAVPGAFVQVARLHASLPTILSRLEGRESAASLAWHQRRAPELIAIMDRNQIGDIHIDTDGQTLETIAQDVLLQAGWTG